MGGRCGMKNNSKKARYLIYFIIIWAVQMAAAFYFCTQKAGFHEDEYYTYYSTARTAGFYVEDGKWMDAETYRNEFVVLPGQQFQYGLVRQVQSWDVHPPVYYWIFHTAASCVPGVFSKWIGLGINLFFHGINIILLTRMSYFAGGRNEKLALMATLFYGLTPAAISGVVFIRMYELLTMFVLLCAILHVQEIRRLQSQIDKQAGQYVENVHMKPQGNGSGTAVEKDRQETGKLSFIRFLLPLMVVTYLGFLTQYYYFIFLFYMAIAFCVFLLWRDKNLWNCLRYGISQLAAFGLAYLTYPSCLGQMFRGQRGAQATENFFDLSNTVMRFRFFLDLLDVYVFGKLLAGFLLVVIGLILFVYFSRSKGQLLLQDRAVPWWPMGILCFSAAGYFLTVSKTALLLGDTSNRYQLPVYGMIVLLLFWAIYSMWVHCVPHRNWSVYLAAAALVICLALDAAGLMSGRVVFLYPEDQEQTAFAKRQEQAGTPVVYLYNEGADWCIWDVANELMEYSGVYFASAGNDNLIADAVIANTPALVLYLADGADVQAQIDRILGSNKKLTGYELLYEEKYCDVYYFYSGN